MRDCEPPFAAHCSDSLPNSLGSPLVAFAQLSALVESIRGLAMVQDVVPRHFEPVARLLIDHEVTPTSTQPTPNHSRSIGLGQDVELEHVRVAVLHPRQEAAQVLKVIDAHKSPASFTVSTRRQELDELVWRAEPSLKHRAIARQL